MIYQKHKNDCLQACLATLLKIPYSDIPEFYKLYPDNWREEECEEGGEFTAAYDKWLSSRDYFRIRFDAVYDKEKRVIAVPYISGKPFVCMGTLKKEDRAYSHAVLIEISDIVEVIHDPKEDSDYEIYDLTGIELILPSA